ncbi:MAG TPA: HAD-IIA family hydrolase [Anaerolineae bacterium]|nr:HAD-IIA family hydrolase [Anaerolineae bacterium]HMR62951.1 HAD-IIA family hydrolase [Anaerolineae bacterium]
MSHKFNLEGIYALIIDIDGTLWRGNQPLPGLVDFFDLLQRRGLAYIVVTNNTVKTPGQYWQKFIEAGVSMPPDRVLTAAVATAEYLKQHFDADASIYVIGEAGLKHELRQAGFTLTDNPTLPAEVVVVGGDTGLTYDKLKYAVLAIQRGACLVGTNPDLLIPTEEGLVPEAGTTLAALQAATGVSPKVIGKPESLLFELAVKKMGSHPNQTAMVGDRLDTDILGGQRAGLKTILLTTGVDNQQTAAEKGIYPDAIFSDLAELTAVWPDS